MKKVFLFVISVFIITVFLMTNAFAGGKWPGDYPRFRQKEVCPDTAFTGKVTCGGEPVVGAQVIIDNFASFGEWTIADTDENGDYYAVVPLGYYRIFTWGDNGIPIAYYIHAKWRCGVLPFYFELCP